MRIVAETADGSFQALTPSAFQQESSLQDLLEEHPALVLAGLGDEEIPHIWTIGWEVSTEAGSIDLLLLDSSGGVWVVETKLACNSEVKKQVVGQVLAYASCVADWTASDLQEIGDRYLHERGDDHHSSLVGLMATVLGDSGEAQEILAAAEDRLRDGDLTALIAVDDAPRTLRRLVEFVNEHASFSLLALRFESFRYQGRKLLVPTVFGPVVRDKHRSESARQNWTEARFFEELESQYPQAVDVARQLYDWAQDQGFSVRFGSGKIHGSANFIWPMPGGSDLRVFALWTGGHFTGGWDRQGAYREEPWWEPFIEFLEETSGTTQSPTHAKGVPLSTFEGEGLLEQLQQHILGVIERSPAGIPRK